MASYLGIVALILTDFRTDIVRCANSCTRQGDPAGQDLGYPKVAKFQHASRAHEDVLWLEIPAKCSR